MKKIMIVMCSAALIISLIKFEFLRTQSERPYSEIRSDYLTQGNIDEKFGFISGLNKRDFFTFFTNPSFVGDILVPIGNCAGSGEGDFERCQALLVSIIRKTGEQALGYYPQYAQLMSLINRPYQVVRVLQDMYANDPKKIANALYQLVLANPELASLEFKGDAVDFSLVHYALLKHVAAVVNNPVDQSWAPLLQITMQNWQRGAGTVLRTKIIDFSALDIIALAQADDFEIARARAVNPSALLTTEGLVAALGITF
jgi:hypothetical protein